MEGASVDYFVNPVADWVVAIKAKSKMIVGFDGGAGLDASASKVNGKIHKAVSGGLKSVVWKVSELVGSTQGPLGVGTNGSDE